MGAASAGRGDGASRQVVDGVLRVGAGPARVTVAFEQVREDLRAFVTERAWDAFHNPKDLALSLAIEAGELLEVFQWRDVQAADLAPEDRARIAEEVADVVLYAMLLADKAGIDLPEALAAKLARNRAKYPVEKARGRADKYDKL
jgi:NTP pyrophosphatase (non-canonical NTP hydrolase)